MIELNKKTQQDFLNREWVQKLLDAGVDMSDAKYYLVEYVGGSVTYITYGMSEMRLQGIVDKYIPTYTVSELLYKLHEWMFPNEEAENPIELFARLLIQYHKGEIGISKNATGYSSGT